MLIHVFFPISEKVLLPIGTKPRWCTYKSDENHYYLKFSECGIHSGSQIELACLAFAHYLKIFVLFYYYKNKSRENWKKNLTIQ